MSHYTVAVFTEPDGLTVEELLAPFDENIEMEDYISAPWRTHMWTTP